MSDVKETLQEMAKLTILSNKLNDIQLKNLKTFPFIFFNDLMQVELEYDLSNNMDITTEENTKDLNIQYDITNDVKSQHVTYRLTIAKDMNNNNAMPKRFEALEGSVRNLFWSNLTVKVFINGELKYESKYESK